MKRLSTLLFLAITCAALLTYGGSQLTAQVQAEEAVDVSAPKDSSDVEQSDGVVSEPEVVAYYFHTTYRCVSCRKIEAYSREAIEGGFADELENGTLAFKSVNIDEDENKHFVKEYQLYTKSLVICNMSDGKQVEWKNLAKVWELIRDKEAFLEYVQDEINSYLKEG